MLVPEASPHKRSVSMAAALPSSPQDGSGGFVGVLYVAYICGCVCYNLCP